MCIGSMVGSGIYIITGTAAKEKAGPAIVLSFFIAGLLVYILAACFTELCLRVQRTGSSYMFMYVSMGELPAFFMGWSIMLGCILGGATNGRAWSAYMDFLFDGAIGNFTKHHVALWDLGVPITNYPDFIAAGIVIVIMIVVAIGAQCSSKFNSIFAMLNICVLLFFIVFGFINADLSNWTSSQDDEHSGGFMPFGWTGLLAGSGACFWAFMGFEILAVAVEEADKPARVIPRATALALAFVTVLYMGTAAALTLLTPYYTIDSETPLPSAFAYRGIDWAKYIVGVGPLFGLTTTLLSSIFAFVRIVYAIAEDGLLLPIFARVSKRTKVPLATTFTGGLLTATTALFFDLSEIISFAIVIGLLQYGSIAAAVVILRYRPLENKSTVSAEINHHEQECTTVDNTTRDDKYTAAKLLDTESEDIDYIDLQTPESKNIPCKISAHSMSRTLEKENMSVNRGRRRLFCVPSCLWPAAGAVPRLMGTCCMLMAGLAVGTVQGYDRMQQHGTTWRLLVLVLLIAASTVLLLLLTAISLCEQSTQGLSFKVPFVPWLPALAIMICLLLLVTTATLVSWIGCAVLFILSLLVYFFYGIRHSKLRYPQQHQVKLQSSIQDDRVKLLTSDSDLDEEQEL